MGKKKILILSLSPLHSDPRVYRQIMFLKDSYNLITAGFSDPEVDGVQFILIKKKKIKLLAKLVGALKLKTKQYENYYWSMHDVRSAWPKLVTGEYDLIVANDLSALPLAFELSKLTSAKLFLDAHEYSPREFEDRFIFNFFLKNFWDYICKTYIPEVDSMSTVCQGIADEYEHKYNGKWKIITNAPFYEELLPTTVRSEKISIIHHGGINLTRRIEKMMELADYLDARFELDFMLINNNPPYYEKLLSLAKKNPKINFREPVSMTEIVRTINKYDIGLYMLPPSGFNNQMALPNKFFEFIQGRLALAIWPSPEMGKVVKKYNCGVVSEDYTVESMAEALNSLTVEDIMNFKTNSHKASKELCAEKNREIFLSVIQSLLN